jgi:hypothetical protein
MNVIFLDIDGVYTFHLNNIQIFSNISLLHIFNLIYILN